MMVSRWIQDPSPVWDLIRPYLVDNGNQVVERGLFAGVFDFDSQEKPMAGAFYLKPWTDYCYEIHGGVAKGYWGQGPGVCFSAGKLVFEQTSCLKLVAIIPEFNRLMIACVQKCGMRYEGLISKSFMKWCRLHNQHIYGITKGEFQCLPQQ